MIQTLDGRFLRRVERIEVIRQLCGVATRTYPVLSFPPCSSSRTLLVLARRNCVDKSSREGIQAPSNIYLTPYA